MKIGDEIKIKNSAGILRVKLLQKLNSSDVVKGDCAIMPSFIKLRWECHKAINDKYVIMLSEKGEKKNCYLALLDYEEVEYWKCEFVGGEIPDVIYTLLGE